MSLAWSTPSGLSLNTNEGGSGLLSKGMITGSQYVEDFVEVTLKRKGVFVDKGSCRPTAAGNIRVRFFVEKKEVVKPMEDQID
jgi:hypothetical protein